MNRRKFIKSTSLTGLLLPSVILSSCEQKSTSENRGPRNDTNIVDFELNEVTIDALQDGMSSGKYTARSITQLYMDRIGLIDKNNAYLNAVIELNPDALTIAEALDKERSQGKISWTPSWYSCSDKG